MSLRVTEIFKSIQGESTRAGMPCSFVRLTGCSLRCAWCDTAYAFSGGNELSIEDVISRVKTHGTELVELTGGEPLEQAEVFPLIAKLSDLGMTVLVETGGHVSIAPLDPRAVAILDVKAPGSGMMEFNLAENIDRLRPRDELKFVVSDRRDFDWSLEFVAARELDRRHTVTFSPVWERLPARDLAEWILGSGRNIRLGLQIHKLLWGEEPGR